MTSSRSARVLVIDHEPSVTGWFESQFARSGHDVRTAASGTVGIALFRQWQPDVVVTDLGLPDADGLEILRQIKAARPDVEVVVMAAHGTIPTAVAAITSGASYFLEKPIEAGVTLPLVEKAIERAHLQAENTRLRERLADRAQQTRIIGTSPRVRALLEMVAVVARSEANILILGEHGTGKELVANAIHEQSPRARGPFIKINCAAIPKDLIESELFGYRRGAFTGALSDKAGLFEAAEGGSLLLDEIGEMPPYLQTKLLRALQEREYRPIGGERAVHLDFRLISATNANVDQAVGEGRLREDFYFRINTITLTVPPLRDRREDIPALCDHFLETFCARYDRPPHRIAPAARDVLMRAPWPGNVRELEHAVERALLVSQEGVIQPDDLPESIRSDAAAPPAFSVPPDWTLAQIEKMAILQALERTGWNKQEAAAVLGLYRPTLYSKMRKHQIPDRGRPGRRRSTREA